MMRKVQFEDIIAIVVLRTNIGTIKACPPRHLNIRAMAPSAESRSDNTNEKKKNRNSGKPMTCTMRLAQDST